MLIRTGAHENERSLGSDDVIAMSMSTRPRDSWSVCDLFFELIRIAIIANRGMKSVLDSDRARYRLRLVFWDARNVSSNYNADVNC